LKCEVRERDGVPADGCDDPPLVVNWRNRVDDANGLAHDQTGGARHGDGGSTYSRVGGQSGGGASHRGERPVGRQDDVGALEVGAGREDDDELVIVRRSSNRRIGNGDRLADRVLDGESGCHCDGTGGRPDGCDDAGLLVRFVVDENGLARGKARGGQHIDVGVTYNRLDGQSGGRLDEPRAIPIVQGQGRRDLLAEAGGAVGRTVRWTRRVVAPRVY